MNVEKLSEDELIDLLIAIDNAIDNSRNDGIIKKFRVVEQKFSNVKKIMKNKKVNEVFINLKE